MSTWTYAYRRSLPDSAYACIQPGGTKDDNGHTDEGHRSYPIRDVNGDLDAAHVRNALSRLAQDDTTSCGAGKIRAAAKQLGIGQPAARGEMEPMGSVLDMKASVIDDQAFEDWLAGKRSRPLLAFPYSGPVKGGKDLDRERFTHRTDIKADWFDRRPLLFHHGQDPKVFKSDAIGYVDGLSEDEMGRWVNTWLNIGQTRRELFRRIRANGGELFGSSGTIGYLKKAAPDGEILVWPYVEQTLSPSPQNDASVLMPAKAIIDAFDSAEIPLTTAFKAWFGDLDALGADLAPTSGGSAVTAKAGRVLSALNERRLREALASLSQALEDMATASHPPAE